MSTHSLKESKTSEENLNDFRELIAETSEEKIESRAHLLSLIFLSEAEKAMDRKGWTKKRLAHEIGTSASYLTQLFRGDRLLNFKTIAKIEGALDVRFEITAYESSVYGNTKLTEVDSSRVNDSSE